MRKLKPIEVVKIGACVALYAGFGYLTHLEILTLGIGAVKF
jgi:hypothetical protein